MDTYEKVRTAILRKQQVVATYNGYRREMCPHVIGKKNGRAQALFLQFGGESSSGLSSDLTENWRCIPIDRLEDVEARDGEWYTAPNHSVDPTCVGEVDVGVGEVDVDVDDS